jgi:4-amino-4-deoxy-L-arabinose transferase-like glycosyltransferase
MHFRPLLLACLLAGIALLLYAFHLNAAPLTPEEAAFNTHAQSIRAGWTPIYFRVRDEQWLQPAGVYANALAQRAGGGEASGRFASALLGAINVALVFLIAHLITGRWWIAVIAAVLLMLTPAHWSFAQLGTDAIVPVPLILLWLCHLLRFFQGDSLRSLSAAAAFLGLSIYSHPAAPLTAAFLWTLTLAAARRRNWQRLAIATVVFAAAWLPAALWFYRHPDTYPDTFGRWVILAAHVRSPIDLLASFFNPTTLGNRLSMYWGFWNPSSLFFGPTAPLLLVAPPLIAIGIYRCVRHVQRELPALLLGGALLIPVAGASFGTPRYLAAAAAVLPMLALLVAIGVEQLVTLVVRPAPLEDDEGSMAAEGWNADDIAPRT